MKTILKVLLILAASFLWGACGEKCNPGPVQEDCICTLQYDPVCGCDGETYGNECVAACSGVTNWTEGRCED